MMIPRFPLAVAVALAAAIMVLAPVGEAAAQVRVTTVPFQGAGGAGARRQVQRALDDDRRVTTVDEDRADAAADRVGASSSGSSGIPELAAELEAGMVIQGRVTGRGRRRRVQLTARDRDGREVASARAEVRGNGIERGVRSLLGEGLAQLPAPPPVEREPPPVRTVEGIDVEQPEGERETGEYGGGDEGAAAAPTDWDRRAPLLDVQIGIVPRSREADITFQDSRHGRYNAWYPELAVRAEVRPFNADPSILRGLYGRVFFAHAVGLASKVEGCDPADPTMSCGVDSTFYRLDFAAGLLFSLNDELDLGAEFGAGWDNYALSPNPLLESVEYVYLRPAVRARMRIFRELFVMGAEVGVRPVLSRGEFSSYGAGGDTIGFDVGGSLGGGVALAGNIGFTYAVTLTYVNYWLDFSDPPDPSFAGSSGTDGSLQIGIMAGLGIW